MGKDNKPAEKPAKKPPTDRGGNPGRYSCPNNPNHSVEIGKTCDLCD